ncbi:MAG: hypothetical protein IKO94_01820 [Selenomonadaceae bacterium]|nr:hypothetical protein [Selenomonadaceae bacterium]
MKKRNRTLPAVPLFHLFREQLIPEGVCHHQENQQPEKDVAHAMDPPFLSVLIFIIMVSSGPCKEIYFGFCCNSAGIPFFITK